ncbi:MAG: zinc ribbon domain-containing protein [Deltaproteobacteria bacterium]|nr:zinc ribbon domain-containing protein [Deltaproteobacteria bacterium]
MCYLQPSAMPLYEYECAKGHRFEAIQSVRENPLRRCSVCSATAKRAISQPTLLHNRGIHVFDRVTKDDALRSRPSSLKSFKKDKF